MKSRAIVGLVLVTSTVLACNHPVQTVKLAGRTSFEAGKPFTVVAPEALRVVGNTNQICLEPSPPDIIDGMGGTGLKWGIHRADGVVVGVGAVLLHGDGTADTLPEVAYSQGEYDCLEIGPETKGALHPPYVAARFTAESALTVSRIEWNSWFVE